MSPWKVILATLVIFVAGLFTGAVGVRHFIGPQRGFRPTPEAPFLPRMLREEFVRTLSSEMDLDPDQREKVQKIVRESQQRTQILTQLIEPEMREELRATREAIRDVLKPEQRERYDEFLRRQMARQREMQRGPQGGFRPNRAGPGFNDP